MKLAIDSGIALSNGTFIPRLGLGVWKMQEGRETFDAVRWALEAGYRHIDTAALYANEASVGKALREAEDKGIARKDVFVTTKVWNSDQGYDKTLRAFDRSLSELGFEYVDLYLVHWPVAATFVETYRALETIYASGRAKAIGVSNFLIPHLEKLLFACKIVPMVDQYEYHPYLQQAPLQEFCRKHNIAVTAWAPLMVGRVLKDPLVIALSEKHGKTPAQIVLRWELQKGIVTIPKSTHQERIEENAGLFDFELDGDDMNGMAKLDRGERSGSDPNKFNF